jgi:hypothetical protein
MATTRLGLPIVAIVLLGSTSLARADDASSAAPAPAPAGAPATPNSAGESPGIVPALPVKVEDQSASSSPAIGGHLGMALPIVTFGSKTTAIGADFTTVGITPGVTIHLDAHWAIDFEFIAFNELKNTPAATTFVVDPGVLRKFDGFVAGLRVATQVGAPSNVGLVPIFVVPVKVSNRISWFVEVDVPLFLRDDGRKVQASATGLFQTGVGF